MVLVYAFCIMLRRAIGTSMEKKIRNRNNTGKDFLYIMQMTCTTKFVHKRCSHSEKTWNHNHGEVMIYCLINSNHRLTGPELGWASPAVWGVLIKDTPIDVPRLKQMNWLVYYMAWEILLIWNLLYHIWKNCWWHD